MGWIRPHSADEKGEDEQTTEIRRGNIARTNSVDRDAARQHPVEPAGQAPVQSHIARTPPHQKLYVTPFDLSSDPGSKISEADGFFFYLP